MRLNVFIRQNMEEILVQWESFAFTLLPAGSGMSQVLLRDHAQQILEAVIKDLSASQTDEVQADKSKGLIQKLPGAPRTAAEMHGLLRAMKGFEIKQIAGEYRALRASVLKLWLIACGTSPPNFDDVVRFNEAIDQALAESIDFFTVKIDERRNLFLGMLGHDMRTPLQAIQMTALVLKRINAGEKVSRAAKQLVDGGSRMAALLDELIEFNKIKIGLGVRIVPTPQDMATLLEEELSLIRAAHPKSQLDLHVNGATKGVWDGPSLKRVFSNLVVNAIKYGNDSAPISIKIAGYSDQVTFEVRNKGASLDTTALQGLFEPLEQGKKIQRHGSESLGLGLFIAKQVVTAHSGNIQAYCEGDETVFAVQLPAVSTVTSSRI